MFDYKSRLKNLRGKLRSESLDSFLVTNETNVEYLSGFTGSDSIVLVTPDSQFFLTDSRYTEEAKDTVKGFTIVEVTSSVYDFIGNILRKNHIKKLGFESMNLPFGVLKRFEEYLSNIKFKPLANTVESLRAVKDKSEIGLIKNSIRVTEDVLKETVKTIRPGLSERCLSGLIEYEFIKRSARSSFQTIVACGCNTSKPHAHPTEAKIGKCGFVMIDIGCKLNSYCSDMTRMILMGKIKDKIKEIYFIVRTAQEKALEAIRPGRKISEVDCAGRSYIDKKGFGKFFGHSMGHGIGMDVHEEPSISKRNTGTLKPGMVFTVEPAIYIPKFGGVRIEDMVLVTNRGYELLTK